MVVADESPFVGNLIKGFLESDGIEVVRVCKDGMATLGAIRDLRPDVVTLALELGAISGVDVVREIMRVTPVPVVVVTGVSGRAAASTIEALELGAVDFVLKFSPTAQIDPESVRRDILSKVRAAAEVRVIRNLDSNFETREIDEWKVSLALRPVRNPAETLRQRLPAGILVVGASTGGPVALRELLGELPADFPAPIMVIQHIPGNFTRALVSQLDRSSFFSVQEAQAGEILEPGKVLVAPGDSHILLSPLGAVELHTAPAVRGHRPSIDLAMSSVAEHLGSAAQGVLLSGMGEDGVEGLRAIHARGGWTYAQDLDSCVVDGMPRRALEEGVARTHTSVSEIARLANLHAAKLAQAVLPSANGQAPNATQKSS